MTEYISKDATDKRLSVLCMLAHQTSAMAMKTQEMRIPADFGRQSATKTLTQMTMATTQRHGAQEWDIFVRL